ncbi:MAG: thiamine pyrophosphate-dependent enzyme [Candidatus Diapherotrites archaeon]|nr:thiamine pyrophosphate-dependent enzyme [Candidatus Diapherotrites archaeon]
MKEILLGCEAVALGALHAGISAAFSYPGTPSTEIMEYFLQKKEKYSINAEWCSNEKTAYEAALGVSLAGKRAIVSMKHVGLNVAMDPFVNSAISGIKGGLVIAVADDPGMHSSQNEQDSRYLADFAKIFVFEPADAQEAYNMTFEAFELSERFGLPVMIRLVTRVSHTREAIETRSLKTQNKIDKTMPCKEWVLLPTNARNQFKKLLEKQKDLLIESEKSVFNKTSKKKNSCCAICSGIAFNYFMEVTNGSIPYFKLSTYPMPIKKIKNFSKDFKKIYVFEEGYPFVEEKLCSMLPARKILGKISGAVQRTGELNCEIVKSALGKKIIQNLKASIELPPRPPQPCAGCPHVDLYKALNEAKGSSEIMVFGDIGCYTLGASEPLRAIGSCICMGASVNNARGASIAGAAPSVAIIGDSTFAHSGIPALVEAAKHNNNMVLIILDNGTVAMTGAQETMLSGNSLLQIILGAGVPKERVKFIEPLPQNHELNVSIIKEALSCKGLTVIISKRACIQLLKRR